MAGGSAGRVVRARAARPVVDQPHMARESHTASSRLIGGSASTETLRQEIAFAARCEAKVLIMGETGVGKEVVAHLIHHQSRRQRAPFIIINCAGVPETLLESQFFGHARG